MQVLPTAEGGISRLKIVQKSLGVMSGVWVEPNATLGRRDETGTMRVGLREPAGRVPPCGQDSRLRSLMTSRGIDSGVVVAMPSSIARTGNMDFILIVDGPDNDTVIIACREDRRKSKSYGAEICEPLYLLPLA